MIAAFPSWNWLRSCTTLRDHTVAKTIWDIEWSLRRTVGTGIMTNVLPQNRDIAGKVKKHPDQFPCRCLSFNFKSYFKSSVQVKPPRLSQGCHVLLMSIVRPFNIRRVDWTRITWTKWAITLVGISPSTNINLLCGWINHIGRACRFITWILWFNICRYFLAWQPSTGQRYSPYCWDCHRRTPDIWTSHNCPRKTSISPIS